MIHSKTTNGAGAMMVTVIAIIWNALVWGMLVPSTGPAVWFKGMFVLAGVGLAVGALRRWIARHRSIDVTLQLTHDPVPHGAPTTAMFTFSRPLKVQTWSLQVTIDSPDENLSGFGRVWEHKFALTTVPVLVDGEIMVQSVSADFTLPADLPSTEDDFWYVSMVLQGDDATWPFDIETRPATANEPGFHTDSTTLELPPGWLAAFRWIRRGAYVFSFLVVGWVAWGLFAPTWLPEAPQDDAAAASDIVVSATVDGERVPVLSTDMASDAVSDASEPDASSRLSTRVRTPEFAVLLSNWLLDDGHLRAHLQSRVQVTQGQLRMRIQQLALAPAGACKSADNCKVESIRLVLSQADSDGSYNTLAQSEPLPWAVDLAKDPVALRSDGSFQLTLPQSLAGDQDVRLQLVVQTANAKGHNTLLLSDDTTVASHGNYMALQLALRAAAPDAENLMDPCDRVGSLGEAVRAHCAGQVQFRLDSNAFSGKKELDAALIDAIQHYNSAAVRPLLKAGASPNAVDPLQKSMSALLLASFGDQQQVREMLIKAGAKI